MSTKLLSAVSLKYPVIGRALIDEKYCQTFYNKIMSKTEKHNNFLKKMNKANRIILFWAIGIVTANITVLLICWVVKNDISEFKNYIEIWGFTFLPWSVICGLMWGIVQSMSTAFDAINELKP